MVISHFPAKLYIYISDTSPSDRARDLGVIFDSDLNFSKHFLKYASPVSTIYVISVEFGGHIYSSILLKQYKLH